MKIRYLAQRILPLLLCLTPLAADAADPGCHRLMTEKECGKHNALLAEMRPGDARNQYLADFDRTRKEREAACSVAAWTSRSGELPRFARKTAISD